MHEAIVTWRSQWDAEPQTFSVADEDLNLFHAKIVGAVQGITYGGRSVVLSVTSERVDN